MKAIIINSCRECPYAKNMSREGLLDVFTCTQMKVKLALRYEKTIHPDCKLNDVPSVEEIGLIKKNAWTYDDKNELQTAFIDGIDTGANFVINKITK